MTFKPRLLLDALDDQEARFVVVGGLAMTAHGSSYATFDLNVCYDRDVENHKQIVTSLSQFNPRLRVEGEEPRTPQRDPRTWRRYKNLRHSWRFAGASGEAESVETTPNGFVASTRSCRGRRGASFRGPRLPGRS